MIELTILMPCLNEAETIGACIVRARKLLTDYGIEGEILISDNGSSDGSQRIADDLGARVVNCPVRGYGAALQFGIENAQGVFVLMGDSDDSYHFDEAMAMVQQLRQGYDVCMGTRLKGTIEQGAMPFLNRYLGNPLLTGIGKFLFGLRISDFHCGMRAFSREKVLRLDLVTTGMEWASEMVVKAWLAGLSFSEVPITLHKDGRSRAPHLKRWRDGWRHLRFMLLHCPTWLFTYPGLFMMAMGMLGEAILAKGMVPLGKIRLDVHTMLICSMLVILGMQTVSTGVFARLYSSLTGILPFDEKFDGFIRKFTLEKLLVACLVAGFAGLAGFSHVMWEWYRTGFSELDYRSTMRMLIPALTLIAVSVQGMFNGFMLSILFLKTKVSRRNTPE
jgi:glycosyltransferase involved in cell wall biosynthesis